MNTMKGNSPTSTEIYKALTDQNKNKMKNYVVGFMFSSNMEKVVLIEKQKPEWQKGKLNGVGGSIEHGETPLEAMVREFKEETGVDTTPTHWKMFCEAYDSDNEIRLFLFKCIDYNDSMIDLVRCIESEIPGLFHIDHLGSSWYNRIKLKPETVHNLKTFIPMAANNDFISVKIKCKLR